MTQPKLPPGIKTRRHHNNDGRSQIQRGKTRDQVRRMAKRLGVPVKVRKFDMSQWD